MEAKEMMPMESPTSLSVRVTQSSLAELTDQRSLLKQFIKTQLTEEIDFGIIPGTSKHSLYKPGAEKIANIFQLGSRIVKTEKVLELKQNFAMYEVTVEIFHLPSGRAISQSVGIANSHEVKYKERSKYEGKGQDRKYMGKEETPIGDVLNTLSKMAQKRAYVGAVIIATGASDFFTQDLEDGLPVNGAASSPKPAPAAPIPNSAPKLADPGDFVVTFGTKYKGQTIKIMGRENVAGFKKYLEDSARDQKKPLGGVIKEYCEYAGRYLEQPE